LALPWGVEAQYQPPLAKSGLILGEHQSNSTRLDQLVGISMASRPFGLGFDHPQQYINLLIIFVL
jgi:hypothetical protein